MKRWIVGLAVVAAPFSGAEAKIKTETEAGFKIRREFAMRIVARHEMKKRERIDSYVEMYDGQSFLLSSHADALKLRLKIQDGEGIFQANTKSAIHARSCPAGWPFQIKEKRVGELRVDARQRDDFMIAVQQQLNLLAGSDPYAVRAHVLSLHNHIAGLAIPLKDDLMRVPGTPKWLFTASHTTYKTKWFTKVNLGFGKMQVSVAEAKDYVGQTQIQEKFEVEFEAGDRMSLDGFSRSVCEFLRQQGVRPGDLQADPARPQDETLRRLKRFNMALGF